MGLTVNPDKSEVVIYTRNRNTSGFYKPSIFGKQIPKRDSAKYLGIILDSKLTWSKHVEERLSKCIRIFWCCRSAISNTWGLSPKSIMWIYTAIVRPTLAYGAFLWWRYTLTESGRRKLKHLQRVACLAITGAMSTTPQSALEALLNLPPLDKVIIAEGRATAYRLRHIITSNIYSRLLCRRFSQERS